MALRPFARNPKTGEDEVEETSPDAANDVDQFFSNDRRRRGSRQPDGHQGDEARSDAAQPVEAEGAGQVPATVDYGDAGWYPDAEDPGLMRYWDGFHLTGQVLHVHSRATDAEAVDRPPVSAEAEVGRRAGDVPQASDAELASSVESLPPMNQEEGVFLPPSLTLVVPSPGGTPPVPESTPESGETASGQADDEVEDEADIEVQDADDEVRDEADDEPVDEHDAQDETDELDEPDEQDEPADGLDEHDEHDEHDAEDEPVDEQAEELADETEAPDGAVTTLDRDDSDRRGRDLSQPLVSRSGASPITGEAAGEANRWAKEAATAVARATTAGSPESWKEAARIAAVVSEMTQTLQAAAEADRTATQLAQAAGEAASRARAAEQKSADANRAVQQAQRAADEADSAAQRARRAAVSAKESAERASQAVPGLVEAEKVAAAAAADAQRKAQSLGQIVGTASKADTPTAWSEALRLSSAQVA